MADFVLGRLKFKWRGDWAVSTAYLIDDIVKYGGNTYVVISNHTSQSSVENFYTDLSASKYQLHTEGLFFKGNWVGNVFYKLNDLVKFGAFQYRCTTQHTATDNFDTSKFAVFNEGLQWEDTYDVSTQYQDGDVVSYGGYTYVYVNSTPSAGNTPTDNAYWDVITTGYNNTGTYSHGTAYKTGDVVQYGGNTYVAKANASSQYPSNTNGTLNSTYWDLVVKGFDFQSGGYSATTTYNIGDVVRYTSSTYLAIQDRILNVQPDTDGAKWQLMAQGSETAVLSTRGDLLIQSASGAARLPIGTPGSVLTTDGTDPTWSAAEGKNVYYVANSGSDSNPGTQYLPFKTLYYALGQTTSGDITDFDTITGGTGGTPGVFDVTQSATDGSGTGAQARITTDGSSTPTVVIINGGSGHAAGDVVTFSGSNIGSSSNVTITVVSASVGDVVYVKNGVYRETLPMRVPAGVTVQGESLRGTEIRPKSSTGHQVKTVSITSNLTGATNATYNYVHANATSGSGIAASFVANVVVSGGTASSVTIYHGGTGFVVGNTITIPKASVGGGSGGDLVLTVASLENNDASNMFLVNNTTNIVQLSMKGLTGTPTAGATGKAAVISLDPSGSITSASPYIQNCTSLNGTATGVQIDGLLHSAGNKSILCNDFTQINSDGKGVHALGGGRGEMVSVFTYYNAISFQAESGGFIRGLNCSSGYGEQGAVADGTLASEAPLNVQGRGEMVKYNSTTFVGAATESDFADTVTTSGTPTAATIVGVTSGATATIIRVNVSLDHVHITGRSGNFQQGEVVTITKDDSSTFQVSLDSSFGDSTAAQTGQIGPLIAIDSTDETLASATSIKVGSNVLFAGDTNKFYRISAVSENNTSAKTALIRLTESVTSARAIADNEEGDITTKFSNVRLTGHDFLSIGTGDFTTSNYPATASQPADQSDEVTETNGGRVYFSSTDQDGDFRVGDLFRIQQSTGIATLNADAFDLSGLSELQLGSIGAELGATINEFSTDETFGNDSNTAVPTERAVVGFLKRDQMGTDAMVPPTGTTSQRPTGGNLKTGALRFNSTLVTWEGYNGSQWTGLGGGNPWSTQTSSFSIASNDRVFVDTSGGAVTATLPASPLTGDQVSFIDLAGTFDTNNLTIARNSLKIMGLSENLVVAQEDAGISLVYTGSTYGWKLINN